jgi:hypothetical protein
MANSHVLHIMARPITINLKSRWSETTSSEILGSFTRILSGYLIVLLAVFLFGAFTRDPLLILITVFLLGPLGLLLNFVYSLFKTLVMADKAKRLAEVVDAAASFLMQPDPDFEEFDKALGTEKELVSTGTVIPFLSAAQRLLLQAKLLILYDNERHESTDIWLEEEHRSELKKIALTLETLANSIKYQDERAAYQNISEIYLKTIMVRSQKERLGNVGASRDVSMNFVQDCTNVSELLKIRKFKDARELRNSMLKSLQFQPTNRNKDLDVLSWQALIILWISVRFSVLESAQKRKSNERWSVLMSHVWVGPSKLLATQIARVIECYRTNNFAGIAEQISDSFDSRAIIFRNYLDYVVEFSNSSDP